MFNQIFCLELLLKWPTLLCVSKGGNIDLVQKAFYNIDYWLKFFGLLAFKIFRRESFLSLASARPEGSFRNRVRFDFCCISEQKFVFSFYFLGVRGSFTQPSSFNLVMVVSVGEAIQRFTEILKCRKLTQCDQKKFAKCL